LTEDETANTIIQIKIKKSFQTFIHEKRNILIKKDFAAVAHLHFLP
jgi:hypothetical protein